MVGDEIAETDDPWDQFVRLRLAAADMRQAVAAAQALERETSDGDLCRALEAAITICYARPFSKSNEIGPLREQWYPQDPAGQVTHGDLIDLRNKVYAHTDRGPAREIKNVAALVGLDERAWGEQWIPLNRDALPRIIEQCQTREASFLEGAKQLEPLLPLTAGEE